MYSSSLPAHKNNEICQAVLATNCTCSDSKPVTIFPPDLTIEYYVVKIKKTPEGVFFIDADELHGRIRNAITLPQLLKRRDVVAIFL